MTYDNIMITRNYGLFVPRKIFMDLIIIQHDKCVNTTHFVMGSSQVCIIGVFFHFGSLQMHNED